MLNQISKPQQTHLALSTAQIDQKDKPFKMVLPELLLIQKKDTTVLQICTLVPQEDIHSTLDQDQSDFIDIYQTII